MKIDFRRLLLSEATVATLGELRRNAYSPKFGNRLREEALRWNRHDDESFHFGAFHADKLVSTIRLTRIENAQVFETILQIPADSAFSSLPCWALSRAATDPNYIGQSINMQLRAEAFRFLLTRGTTAKRQLDSQELRGEKYVYGTALNTSSRLDFLKSLGYELLPGMQQWDGYISAAPDEIAVFRLAIENLEPAILKIDSRR